MTFFITAAHPTCPLMLPEGERTEKQVYTGTACLALIDAEVTAEVWEDLLYDGYDHEHGAGALMLNSASIGTHLEHDGDFPVELVLDAQGAVVGFRVNLDPYADDLADVRALDGDDDAHSHGHGHEHAHADGHSHNHSHAHDDAHGHSHDHGHDAHPHDGGHVDGWSVPETIRLLTAQAVFGDPAGLPEADNTGDLIDITFPAPGGQLTMSVFTDHKLRRELVALWTR